MKILLTLLSTILISACSTTHLKSIDNTTLNIRQQQIIAKEFVLLLKQNIILDNNSIILDNTIPNYKALEQQLRFGGYFVDTANKKNIPSLIYQIKQEDNRLFINIKFKNRIVNKSYIITPTALVSITPLTIIDLK